MRFIIAPDWLIAMQDNDLLSSKQVLNVYGYQPDGRGTSQLVDKGYLPKPDKIAHHGQKIRNYWLVRTIKNNVKLPSEIIK